MFQNDYLLRVIGEAVAALLGRRRGPEAEVAEAARTWTGLDTDTAERLGTDALVGLFTADPLAGEKALLLGLALGERALAARRRGDLPRDAALTEKALSLAAHGLRIRPDLETDEVQEAIAALMRES